MCQRSGKQLSKHRNCILLNRSDGINKISVGARWVSDDRAAQWQSMNIFGLDARPKAKCLLACGDLMMIAFICYNLEW